MQRVLGMIKHDEGVRFIIGKCRGSNRVNTWQGKQSETGKNTRQEGKYREGKNQYVVQRNTRNWKIFCKGDNGPEKKETVRKNMENIF